MAATSRPEWIAALRGDDADLRRLVGMTGTGWQIRDEGGWYGLHADQFESLGEGGQSVSRLTPS